jgi:dTDP-4-amino-4,6-dideoxygalactose transaminase
MTGPDMAQIIDYNAPHMTGRELDYIAQAHANAVLAGDGPFTERCHAWLESRTGCRPALLTHSCTAALEMAAILIGIGPGDEVIMPSYTFVSTANAFVLRGGVPVFVDIRPDTLNIDESLIEAAVTPRTRAIVPVHYAGVGCEMETIMAIAGRHGLYVIEDAAQGVMATYRDRPLGSIGHLGAYSFHETKNVISGEGGALLVNDARFAGRAEIIREKGTDRSRFFRGEVDRYTWQDIGSSYLPSELTAAFLWAQLEEADSITDRRRQIWETYHRLLEPLEAEGLLRRPFVPEGCTGNAHLYHVLVPTAACRAQLIAGLRARGIVAIFHYVPLHDSPAGRRYGRVHGSLAVTNDAAGRIVRLPLWLGMTGETVERVVTAVAEILRSGEGA